MMLSKLSYQKRVKLLPWVSVMAFLLVYWFAVGETFKLRREAKALEKEAVTLERAPMEMNTLKQKLTELNSIAGQNRMVNGTDPLMELTSKVAASHQVTLSEYQPVHIYSYQDYTVETRMISFEASFIPSLKVLYDLEKSYRFGKIVSVSFFTKTDVQTSRKQLYMQVFIQSIQNEKQKT